MYKFFVKTIIGAAIIASWSNASAVMLGFDVLTSRINTGDTVEVGVTISGLGDQSPDSLSTFDLDVWYDEGILSFNDAIFGDSVLGNQLDLLAFGTLNAVTRGTGVINLMELSFDLPDDLDMLQAGSFTLATLSFTAISAGTSVLDLTINALGDSLGDSLSASATSESVAVSEPSVLVLMGIGFLGIALANAKRANIN